MKNRYREAMERIEVTEEMRSRILKNLETADLSDAKRIRFPRRWLSLAACLAVLVVGVLTLPYLQNQTAPPDNEDVIMAIPQIDEASSAEELAQLVDFPVTDVTGLPFVPETADYLAYWDELAQITYTGSQGESAVFRKSVDTEDNSGDFNEYADVQTVETDGGTVTLKGRNGLYLLAVWFRDGYAYSLSLSDGLSADAWTTLVERIS